MDRAWHPWRLSRVVVIIAVCWTEKSPWILLEEIQVILETSQQLSFGRFPDLLQSCNARFQCHDTTVRHNDNRAVYSKQRKQERDTLTSEIESEWGRIISFTLCFMVAKGRSCSLRQVLYRHLGMQYVQPTSLYSDDHAHLRDATSASDLVVMPHHRARHRF